MIAIGVRQKPRISVFSEKAPSLKLATVSPNTNSNTVLPSKIAVILGKKGDKGVKGDKGDSGISFVSNLLNAPPENGIYIVQNFQNASFAETPEEPAIVLVLGNRKFQLLLTEI